MSIVQSLQIVKFIFKESGGTPNQMQYLNFQKYVCRFCFDFRMGLQQAGYVPDLCKKGSCKKINNSATTGGRGSVCSELLVSLSAGQRFSVLHFDFPAFLK